MGWTSWIGSWFRPRRRARGRGRSGFGGDGEIRLVVEAPKVQIDHNNFPHFSGLANELDGTSKRSSQQTSVRSRLGRAFPLAHPISDLRQFAGRRELVRNVIRSIEERRMHVVIYGDRGMGKTSLLRIIAILAQDARYLVRYTSCSQSSDFDSIFRAIARDIPLLYHGRTDPTSEQVEKGKTLADLFDDHPLTSSYLSEILEGVSGTRLLIVLDEFDRADSIEFRLSVAELIKNLSDRDSRVQILIGGVAANLAELIQHIPSIRRNLIGIPVRKMTDDEISEIIDNGVWISRLPFDETARQALVKVTNGSPYLANLIAHQASGRAVDRGASEVTQADVANTVSAIAAEFSLRLDEDAAEQLKTLLAQLDHAVIAEAGRHALDHFGRLPDASLDMFRAVAWATGRQPDWVDARGEFRFVDDSIPLVLWLTTAHAEAVTV